MTIGQRIAQKRKEMGISQEILGERMGVSRQAIYKWESDTALPEIEKLVLLSKLFGVSVGWLLGVEEDAPQQTDAMNQDQIDLVEQIVHRYIDAQPQPKPRRRWPWVAAICVLLLIFVQLFSRMDQLSNQYNNLHSAVGNITNSVNSQINSIASRVEEILMAQNQLTAEFEARLVDVDYGSSTVSVSAKAVPKTYVLGMRGVLVVDCGSGPMEFECALADGSVFLGEAQVPLTDSITVSVAFIQPDGTRQTQVLKSYSNLLRDSYAELSISDPFSPLDHFQNGTFIMDDSYVSIHSFSPGKGSEAQITQYHVGLFRNKKLVGWCEPCDMPPDYSTNITDIKFFRLPVSKLEGLQAGDLVEIAVLVTDSYGRQYMCYDIPYVVVLKEDGTYYLTWPNTVLYDRDPANWIFE